MMPESLPPIFDADGHIFEDTDAIFGRLPEPFRNERRHPGQNPFPQLDHMHLPIGRPPVGAFDSRVGVPEWRNFARDLGLRGAVLYPTWGLSYGRIQNPGWARVVTRAYNDWVTEQYCGDESPLHAMALIPLQDPEAGAAELRRAVTELGMPGAMLPSTGLLGYLGDKKYWPVYEAANDLGCALAIHGGAHQGLGLDHMMTFPPVHALGHPIGLMINLASLVFSGVFERFPNIRFAFLEAGVAWLLVCLERFGGSSKAFQPWEPELEGQRLSGGALTRELLSNLRSGRLFVGVEGDEIALSAAIKITGARPYVFSSDFPHEVNTEICRHEVEELLSSDEVSGADARAILFDNVAELYGIKVPAQAS
jgi:uncharacterized protein